MDAVALLESALSGIVFHNQSVPVNRIHNKGTAKTHITFYVLLDHVEVFADDEEQESSMHFTVDVWTNNPCFGGIIADVKTRLKNAGFVITSTGPEIYENDTQIYHIPIDCWIENLEED